jgi:tetratricopeptide (TPR) repeat protein
MMQKFRSPAWIVVLAVMLLCSTPIARAENGIIHVVVRNPQGRPVSGVRLSTLGRYSTSFMTEGETGKTRVVLAPEIRESQLITLVLLPVSAKDYVLISPWDGITPVPCFDERVECSLEIIVARRSDKQALISGQVVSAMTRMVTKFMAANESQGTEAARQNALRELSELYGLPANDIDHAIRELGPKSADKLVQGLTLQYEGKLDEATPLIDESVETRKKDLASARKLQRNATIRLVEAEMAQASLAGAQGNAERQAKAYAEASDALPNDPYILNLAGNVYARLGNLDLAVSYGRKCFDISNGGLGPDHWLTIICLQNMVSHIEKQGDLSEAVNWRSKLVQSDELALSSTTDSQFTPIMQKMRSGEGDVELNGVSLYGAVLGFRQFAKEQGRKENLDTPKDSRKPTVIYFVRYYEAVEKLVNTALEVDKAGLAESTLKHAADVFKKFVSDASNSKYERESVTDLLVNDLTLLGSTYARGKKHELADASFKEALSLSEANNGADAPELVVVLSDFGFALMEEGKGEEAEILFRRANQIIKGEDKPDVTATIQLKTNLMFLLSAEGKATEAEMIAVERLDFTRKVFGIDSAANFHPLIDLGDMYSLQHESDKAESRYLEALEVVKNEPKATAERKSALEKLSKLYAISKEVAKGKAVILQLVKIGEEQKDLPELVELYATLGLLDLIQNQNEEAETALKKALELQVAAGIAEDSRLFRDLAVSLDNQNKISEAATAFEHWLTLTRNGQSKTDLAPVIKRVANFYYSRSQYVKAEQLMREWIALCGELHCTDSDLELVRESLRQLEGQHQTSQPEHRKMYR